MVQICHRLSDLGRILRMSTKFVDERLPVMIFINKVAANFRTTNFIKHQIKYYWNISNKSLKFRSQRVFFLFVKKQIMSHYI